MNLKRFEAAFKATFPTGTVEIKDGSVMVDAPGVPESVIEEWMDNYINPNAHVTQDGVYTTPT